MQQNIQDKRLNKIKTPDVCVCAWISKTIVSYHIQDAFRYGVNKVIYFSRENFMWSIYTNAIHHIYFRDVPVLVANANGQMSGSNVSACQRHTRAVDLYMIHLPMCSPELCAEAQWCALIPSAAFSANPDLIHYR